jgi:hypothetical protein
MPVGAIRLFVRIVQSLHHNPERAVYDELDPIAAEYGDFAYIGSRRALRELVITQAEQLRQRAKYISKGELGPLASVNPELAKRIERLAGCEDAESATAEWFGKQWEKDSGVFPDFLLAWDGVETLGNGALLELKDSKESTIASFNSTIPTRSKSLDGVSQLMGSQMVVNAALLRDYPHSTASDYFSRLRRCFYLVRTRKRNAANVRISLVEGSFFETLPKDRLLEEVWNQVLADSGVPEANRAAVVERLKELEQSSIARSRDIAKASVKPRLRLMAEVHPDANLHGYKDILPRTVNLVLKHEEGYDEERLRRRLIEDGCADATLERDGETVWLTLTVDGVTLRCKCFSILHKRNGQHWVLQWTLPRN